MSLQSEMQDLRIEAISDEQIQAAAILTQSIISQAKVLSELIIAEAVKLAKARLDDDAPPIIV